MTGLITSIAFVLVIAIEWGLTVGIIKLITLCFGIAFSLKIATGIWLIIMIMQGIFRGYNTSGKENK